MEGVGDKEVTGEGVEEESGSQGKRADREAKTCNTPKNCRPDAPGRRATMQSVGGDGGGRETGK